MFRPANYILLLVVLIASCQERKTEKEDVAYWKHSFVDSSLSLLFKNQDTTKALHYFDSSFQQSSGHSFYPRSARFDLLANYNYFFTGNNHATAAMIDSALSFYHSEDLQNRYPRSYVGLLLFGGQIAYRLTQYSKANEYYFRAKKIADAHLNPCERTAFNYNIAMVLFRQQNFKASLDYFRLAYSLQESCAPQTTAVVLQQQEIQSNIGLCFVQLKNYDSALHYFDNALRIANRYKDSLGPAFMDKIYGVIYGHKAMVAMAREQWKEAEQLSLKSIVLNDREGYEVENARSVKLQLANIYSQEKNFFSMFHLLSDMQGEISTVSPKQRSEWNRLMALYYEQTNHPGSAISYLKTWFTLNDSIEKEQKQLTAADVNRQLDEKEQQLQITKLKKDNQLAFVSLWVTVVFSLMAVIIIYLVYQNYRRSRKSLAISRSLNEEIQKQKAAREKEAKQRHKLITEAVIRAQEKERSLIGLELHDNINQVLTTVKLYNEMVLQGVAEPETLLPRSMNFLQDCINEIRSLSKRLSAPTLGKISLEESVKDLIDSINATSKVKITREISGLNQEMLKQELHTGIYRILQEQLNNVIKHADASEVWVRLERKENNIQLSVVDNGKGFCASKDKTGIGLMNMQTRAENLNGSFELESEPGRGCRVSVVLPCDH